jgi:hypothetical protein
MANTVTSSDSGKSKVISMRQDDKERKGDKDFSAHWNMEIASSG